MKGSVLIAVAVQSKDHGVYRKYTVTVGRKPGSQAHYYVHDVHSVTDLLGRLADETMYPRQEASEEGPADSPAATQRYAVQNSQTMPAGGSGHFEKPQKLQATPIEEGAEGPEEEPS
ncbi:Trehalose-6-P synthase/phosphatase complex synthase subunit, partial [Perkinsus olseni]